MKSKKSNPKNTPLEITPAAKEFSNTIFEFRQACNNKEEQLAANFSLTTSEVKMLRLFEDTTTLPVSEICQKLALTNGRISHISSSLEAKGYIKRTTDKNDRRSVTITLTAKSRPFLNKITSCYINLYDEILDKIDKKKRNDLLQSLKLTVEALSQCDKKK